MPLHIIEVLAPLNLRSALKLHDGSAVELKIAARNICKIPAADYLMWASLWLGRSHWPYKKDRYFRASLETAITLGATQSIRRFGYKNMAKIKLRNVLNSLSLTRRIVSSYDSSTNNKEGPRFHRQDSDKLSGLDRTVATIKNLLNYTKTSYSSYSAQEYEAGYHTIRLAGDVLPGQRNPEARLDCLGIDFEGATVLDLGCNQGGMLHSLGSRIKWGVGIDYDSRMINAANKIAHVNNTDNLSFYVFDLEKETLDIIRDFLPSERVDFIFLLSVCMWIANWKEVVIFCSSISNAMIFESNGTDDQQDEQISFLREVYVNVEQMTDESSDDPGQKSRRMYKAYDLRRRETQSGTTGSLKIGQSS